MHWKSIELMTAMVKFFDSALLYFRNDFFGSVIVSRADNGVVNLLKSLGKGSNVYEEGKGRLEVAIREYDQAVMDCTAFGIDGQPAPIQG